MFVSACRYTDGSSVNFLLECCAMDPRFKNLQWLEVEERDNIYDRVVRRIVEQCEQSEQSTDVASLSHTESDSQTGAN